GEESSTAAVTIAVDGGLRSAVCCRHDAGRKEVRSVHAASHSDAGSASRRRLVVHAEAIQKAGSRRRGGSGGPATAGAARHGPPISALLLQPAPWRGGWRRAGDGGWLG